MICDTLAAAEVEAEVITRVLRSQDWVRRHTYYSFLKEQCGGRVQSKADYYKMIITFVKDMMGADELLEGNNLTRFSGAFVFAVSGGDVVGWVEWGCTCPAAAGMYLSCRIRLSPFDIGDAVIPLTGPYKATKKVQKTLVYFWGLARVRHTRSKRPCTKVQSVIHDFFKVAISLPPPSPLSSSSPSSSSSSALVISVSLGAAALG